MGECMKCRYSKEGKCRFNNDSCNGRWRGDRKYCHCPDNSLKTKPLPF